MCRAGACGADAGVEGRMWGLEGNGAGVVAGGRRAGPRAVGGVPGVGRRGGRGGQDMPPCHYELRGICGCVTGPVHTLKTAHDMPSQRDACVACSLSRRHHSPRGLRLHIWWPRRQPQASGGAGGLHHAAGGLGRSRRPVTRVSLTRVSPWRRWRASSRLGWPSRHVCYGDTCHCRHPCASTQPIPSRGKHLVGRLREQRGCNRAERQVMERARSSLY